LYICNIQFIIKKMGKLLVKLGLWIQRLECKFQCSWNWLISKLLFKVDTCPNKLCTCSK
jgi:hypothetical protein